MEQFLNILKFELFSHLKNKTFIIITIISMIFAGGVFCIPQIISFFDDNFGNEKEYSLDENINDEIEHTNILINDPSNKIFGILQNSSYLGDVNFEITNKSQIELEEIIENDDSYDSAIITHNELSYTHIIRSVSTFEHVIKSVLDEEYQKEKLGLFGISEDVYIEVSTADINSTTINVGKSSSLQSYLYTYTLILVLYFIIIIYGQLIASSVATEKSSKTMEILITSAKPVNLFYGKVLGATLSGLTQIVLIFSVALLSFELNKTYLGIELNEIFGNLGSSDVIFTMVLFVLGVLMYSIMFGSVGALASKVEDIGNLSVPILIIFMVGFFVTTSGMAIGDFNSTSMVIASYIPFTSPMAMLARINMSDISMLEVVISIMILIISIFITGSISSKIYKFGVLMNSAPPKFNKLIKMLFSK